MFLHGLDQVPAAERAQWTSQLEQSNKQFQGAMLAEDVLSDPAFEKLMGFTPACLQPWLAAGQRVPDVLQAELRQELTGYAPGQAIAEALNAEALRDRHPLDKAQYVWIKTMLEGQILTWGGDRVDMANSMEARQPFLDLHLAEFAADIPRQARERAAQLGWS